MATHEEKVDKYLKKKSREQLLEDIMDQISDWDMDTLLEYALEKIMEPIENLSDDDLRKEYYEWFPYKFDDEKFDDDKEDALKKQVCHCDIHKLMRGDGHETYCPDYKA